MGVSLEVLDVWLLARQNMASGVHTKNVGNLYLVPFNTTAHLAVDEKRPMARKRKVPTKEWVAIPYTESRGCPYD